MASTYKAINTMTVADTVNIPELIIYPSDNFVHHNEPFMYGVHEWFIMMDQANSPHKSGGWGF